LLYSVIIVTIVSESPVSIGETIEIQTIIDCGVSKITYINLFRKPSLYELISKDAYFFLEKQQLKV